MSCPVPMGSTPHARREVTLQNSDSVYSCGRRLASATWTWRERARLSFLPSPILGNAMCIRESSNNITDHVGRCRGTPAQKNRRRPSRPRRSVDERPRLVSWGASLLTRKLRVDNVVGLRGFEVFLFAFVPCLEGGVRYKAADVDEKIQRPHACNEVLS